MLLSKKELLTNVEKAHAVYLDQISEELLKEAGLDPQVAILPKNFNQKIRYLGNLLVQICFNYRSKDEVLRAELRCIATALSYLLNSCSFESDQYEDFDRTEIDRKLRRNL